MTVQANTTAPVANVSPKRAKKPFEGYWQEFSLADGTLFDQGNIWLPDRDGNLVKAFVTNLTSSHPLTFTVEVEWEHFGTLTFEPKDGWEADNPQHANKVCMTGRLVDGNGVERTPMVVFRNNRTDGTGFAFAMYKSTPKIESTRTGGSIFDRI